MKSIKNKKITKPKYNLFQNSGFMINTAWKSKKSVLWLVLAVSVSGVAKNLVELFMAPAVLGVIQSGEPAGKFVTLIILFTAALVAVNASESYVSRNTLFGRTSVRLKIISLMQEKLMTMSYPNLENQDIQKKYDKATMATSSNDQATEEIWNTLSDLIKNITGFIIYLLLLSSLNPFIIVLVAVTTTAGFFVNNYLNGWGYRHRDEEAEYSRKMNYLTNKSQDHTLAKDIRIFNMKPWMGEVYDSTLRLYNAFISRGEKVYIWTNIIDIVLTFARNGIAYFFLINMVLYKGVSVAQFLLYFSAIGGFTAWIGGILSGFSTLHKQSLDLSAVREFLECPEVFKFNDGESLEPKPGKDYELELCNVTFRYPGAVKDTLEHVSLKIRPGEKLAVVGLNGAGKTTLVKLICGLYDPTEGEVLLNGTNIKKYNRHDYYKHFSAVFQNFSMLAGTVAGNIAQTDKAIDMTKVKNCAEKAGIFEKLDGLPRGFDTCLCKEVYEDGASLSGGETQQLMLARALYKNAPIIVLDEPTAALDPIAEKDMYNKYNELTAGRTAVYISHRLASTRFCDRIILIDSNKILEEGTHDELTEKGGIYAGLFEIQSRYYREGAIENE